jgi:hypothetical protein
VGGLACENEKVCSRCILKPPLEKSTDLASFVFLSVLVYDSQLSLSMYITSIILPQFSSWKCQIYPQRQLCYNFTTALYKRNNVPATFATISFALEQLASVELVKLLKNQMFKEPAIPECISSLRILRVNGGEHSAPNNAI